MCREVPCPPQPQNTVTLSQAVSLYQAPPAQLPTPFPEGLTRASTKKGPFSVRKVGRSFANRPASRSEGRMPPPPKKNPIWEMPLFGNGVNYSEGRGGARSMPGEGCFPCHPRRGSDSFRPPRPPSPEGSPPRHRAAGFAAGGGDDKPAPLGSPRPPRPLFLLPFELCHAPAPRFEQPKGLEPRRSVTVVSKTPFCTRGTVLGAGVVTQPLDGIRSRCQPGVTGTEGSQAPTDRPGMLSRSGTREERNGAAAGSGTSSCLPGRGSPGPEQSQPQRLFLLPNRQHTRFLRSP